MREIRQAKSKLWYIWHNFPPRRYLNLIRQVRNWPTYLAWKLRHYRAPDRLEVLLRSGLRFEITRESRVEFKLIFMRDDYTWPLPVIAPSEAETIIDLGANIGLFTIFAAANFPQCPIISVEPFPKNAAVLTANVHRNRLGQCRIRHVAISDRRGQVTFGSASAQAHPTDSRISPDAIIDGKDFVTCEVITLDDLLADCAGNIALLKIDIEGAEYEALYGASDATLARIRRIGIETEDIDTVHRNTESLTAFLRSKGFETIEVTPHMLHAWRV